MKNYLMKLMSTAIRIFAGQFGIYPISQILLSSLFLMHLTNMAEE